MEKYVVRKRSNNKFQFNRKASKGEIILTWKPQMVR